MSNFYFFLILFYCIVSGSFVASLLIDKKPWENYFDLIVQSILAMLAGPVLCFLILIVFCFVLFVEFPKRIFNFFVKGI